MLLAGIAGINTVGLSTDTGASGIHRFRTENKTTLISVKVLEKGSGYTNRKLRVNPTGVSTSYDTINFTNHGFETEDIVEYNFQSGGSIISGLSTSNQYRVVKIDDNSFKLTSNSVNLEKKKYVNISSSGVWFTRIFLS